ncbi:MAG: VOC family protein [Maritimibacter sp.]|nr:VOC family protein [Maritimibacter sp.]
MQITQYYPVIQTDDVAGTADFNRRHFGFRALFDSNWYVHLQNERDEAVNLAILDCDHETIPQAGRGRVTAGLILNFEVEDVDGEDTRLRQAGVTVAKSLRDEDFGQRHAIYLDPNGNLIDVIKPIPPTEDFAAGYAAEALPG